MKKGLLIIVVLVLIVVGVAPVGFGYWAEDRFDALVQKIQDSGMVEVKEVSTERGWFQSSREMVVEVSGDLGEAYRAYQEKAGSGEGAPLYLTFRSQIHHGPVPFTGSDAGSMVPAVGRVTTELVAIGDEPVTREDLPLDVETRLGLTGGGVTRFALPGSSIPLKGGATQMEWQGLDGHVRFSASLKDVESHLTVPLLEITDQQGHMLLSNAQLRTDAHEGLEGLTLGDASFTVDGFDLEPSVGQNVHIREVSVDMQTTESDASDAGLVDSQVMMRVGELRAGGLEFGPASYALALRRLDAASLVKIQKAVEELQKKELPPDQASMMMGATLIGVLPELLKKGPVLEIREVSVDSEYGTVSGEGRLTVDTSNPMVLSNPMLLKNAVIANAELAVAESLLVALAARGLKKELSDLDMDYSDDQIQSMARLRVQNRMTNPPAGRFFELEDGVYRFQGSIRKGEVTVNGEPLNLNPAALGQR